MTSTASPSERPSFGDLVRELVPLAEAIAGYGPPVIVLAGPWVLLALVLAGPFAFLLTLLAAMLLVATLAVGITAAIVAGPYLLIRRVRTARARRAVRHDRAPQLVTRVAT
jgi:hypothetical protein